MNKKMLILMLSLMCGVNFAHAGYNDNLGGEVEDVLTYSNGLILFRLKNQPVNHPECNAQYFSLATDINSVILNRMLSRLLTAYSTKTPVNIGFDNAGDCGNSYIRVHRVG